MSVAAAGIGGGVGFASKCKILLVRESTSPVLASTSVKYLAGTPVRSTVSMVTSYTNL